MSDEKVFTMEEVARHNKADDAWLVIDGDVYDITKFIKFHPGGSALLAAHAGTDGTEAFFDMHKTEVLYKYQRLKIGRLSVAKADRKRAVDQMIPGTLSQVPYAEESYLQGWKSPIYEEKHRVFRQAVRKFYDENIRPIAAQAAKTNKTPPLSLFQKLGKAGLLATQLAPSPEVSAIMKANGVPTAPGGIPWEEYDIFMEKICHEEHARVGVPGYADGITAGYSISAPTIINYGTPEMKKTVLPEVLLGNKRIVLAITEPFAGSDVAGLKATAVKSADGSHYIVNGVKKWITGGVDAEYFITGVRTGGRGMGGISLLLIERSEGVTTKLIKTSYSASAGTAYVIFENVKVPCKNILGKENQGFKCIVQNFNHERWMIVANVYAACRLVLTDSILWANQRKVFGKPLINQPVIQGKLSEMAAQIEALAAWIDLITYQMHTLSYKDQQTKLAGPIALLKYYSTRVAYMCADHSSQIFGGRAITRTGMGQNIERFSRAVKYTAIYGGSEEIMQSLAAKQMLKLIPRNARL